MVDASRSSTERAPEPPAASAYAKPLPKITEENRPFWSAARQGRLCMQRCVACGHLRYPVAPVCPRCLSEDHDWETLSGNGTIFSFVVFHQVYDRAFRDDVPYNVALVQLDEGPRMFSNIVPAGGATPKVGDRVEACFEPVTAEVTLPRFRIAG
jgi:uncharacterized OB-fold protein